MAAALARSAEALGMAKTTLHDKIRKYRLGPWLTACCGAVLPSLPAVKFRT